ncbi:MAG: LON peptidase substrate-binding domain-containing protein [Rhodomicrobium sp.]
MGITDRYRSPADLPARLPVFPLQGCILLPRSNLPLNIFEPRYLTMIDDVIAGNRIVGIVQPVGAEEESPASKGHPLRQTGCAGRLSAFSETEDGRLLITLTGICRFDLTGEVQTAKPYRICDVTFSPYQKDLVRGHGQNSVDWTRFLQVLKSYLDARKLTADWESIQRSPTELLINTLSMISPYGPEEKQALLEAPDHKTRSEVLMALAEMEIAAPSSGSGTSLH